MELWIVLRRKPLYHVINIIVPAAILSVCQLGTFWISHKDSRKVEMTATNLVAFSVFLLTVGDQLPNASSSIPLIFYYLDLQMLAIGISCLLQSFNTHLANKARSIKIVSISTKSNFYIDDEIHRRHDILVGESVPTWLQWLKYIADVLTLKSLTTKIVNTNRHVEFWVPDKVWSRQDSFETCYFSLYRLQPTRKIGVPKQLKNANNYEISKSRRKLLKKRVVFIKQWLSVATSFRRLLFFVYLVFIVTVPIGFFWLLPTRHPGHIRRPKAYNYLSNNSL